MRVYKRKNVKPGDWSSGYSPERPWMASGTPEDSRETCWPTWDEAMAWVTMPSKDRAAIIEHDAKFEMGQ